MWRLAPLCAVLLLAACDPSDPESGRGFLTDFTTPGSSGGRDALSDPADLPDPIQAVAIANKEIVVAGPRGYCVDPSTVSSSSRGGFAMLGSCNILSGGEEGPVVAPALITVTVGPRERAPVLPDPETIARISGGSATMPTTEGGFVAVRMESGGEDVLASGDPRYWRGAFLRSGRLIVIALYAPEGSALTGTQGRNLIAAVRARIDRASPSTPGAVSGTQETPSRG